MEISQSRASRNLGIIKDAGLLKDRRNGQRVQYALDEEGTASYSALLELLNNSLDADETILKDKERLKQAVKIGDVKI